MGEKIGPQKGSGSGESSASSLAIPTESIMLPGTGTAQVRPQIPQPTPLIVPIVPVVQRPPIVPVFNPNAQAAILRPNAGLAAGLNVMHNQNLAVALAAQQQANLAAAAAAEKNAQAQAAVAAANSLNVAGASAMIPKPQAKMPTKAASSVINEDQSGPS